MEEVERDGDALTLRTTVDEVSAIAATLLEALDGGYALPKDVWEELVGAPREQVRTLLDQLMTVLRD